MKFYCNPTYNGVAPNLDASPHIIIHMVATGVNQIIKVVIIIIAFRFFPQEQ